MEVMRGVPSNLLPAGPTEYSFLGVLGPLNEDSKQGDKKNPVTRRAWPKVILGAGPQHRIPDPNPFKSLEIIQSGWQGNMSYPIEFPKTPLKHPGTRQSSSARPWGVGPLFLLSLLLEQGSWPPSTQQFTDTQM